MRLAQRGQIAGDDRQVAHRLVSSRHAQPLSTAMLGQTGVLQALRKGH